MPLPFIILTSIVICLAILEVCLRLVFGFGNPLIYRADEKIGYLLAPSQKTRRFGNRIEINQYSMRTATITPIPSDTTFRVLLLGDSLANGGWWTDQANTISEIMSRHLSSRNPQPPLPHRKSGSAASNLSHIEVLNASTNSWGPRNQLAYLEKFGHFQSQVVVLLLNTDDLFAKMPTPWPVGRERNYPDHKPPLALIEVIQRYGLNRPVPKNPASPPDSPDLVGVNLEAIQQMKAIAASANALFLLAMTPLRREIATPGPRDYELKARSRLATFCRNQQILYLDFLPIFNSTEQPATLYRDHIHLSPQGNQLVSQRICQALLDLNPFS